MIRKFIGIFIVLSFAVLFAKESESFITGSHTTPKENDYLTQTEQLNTELKNATRATQKVFVEEFTGLS